MKKINFGLTIVLASLALLAGIASAQENYNCGMGGMMYGMYGGYGAGMMIFSWLFSILVLVALVLFIVWIVKQINKK